MTSVDTITRQIAASLGYPPYELPNELSAAQRATLTNAVARYIVSRPDEFTSGQVANAQRLVDRGGVQGPTDYTLLDKAADFATAYGETAGKVIEGTAGVAGRSLKAIGVNPTVILAVAAVGAILYFGAPVVIPKIRAALSK